MLIYIVYISFLFHIFLQIKPIAFIAFIAFNNRLNDTFDFDPKVFLISGFYCNNKNAFVFFFFFCSMFSPTQARSHCAYPCQCANRDPVCEPGVPHTRDGCGCCPVCARQDGDPCDGIAVCDQRKGLVCQYDDYYSPAGICRGRCTYVCSGGA